MKLTFSIMCTHCSVTKLDRILVKGTVNIDKNDEQILDIKCTQCDQSIELRLRRDDEN